VVSQLKCLIRKEQKRFQQIAINIFSIWFQYFMLQKAPHLSSSAKSGEREKEKIVVKIELEK
jgi:hypothetical protein